MAEAAKTKNDRVAKLIIDDMEIELPIYSGTLGQDVIDVRQLGVLTDLFTFDPGFKSTASCESKITFIDGKNGILLYRGYPIDQLATQVDYMEVCYLLLHGELPNTRQKHDFVTSVKHQTLVHEQISRFFSGFRRDAHPMAIMVGVVGALSAFHNDSIDMNSADYRHSAAIELIAKMPTIAAMSYKYSIGQPFIYPKSNMSYAENFLHMLFATPYEETNLDPIFINAMDSIFTLHADHEQNASTSTVRVAGSTGANPFACISAGIGALWGPAHGGANEACLQMLKIIGTENNIDKFIAKAKDPNDEFRLMGFGHRVYKNYDPRAKVMQETCHKVLDATGQRDNPLFKLAMRLEKIALEDQYFIDKKLYPNVDFYSGLTLSALGIPTNMFTVIFALSRTVGWVANWMEMMSVPGGRLARPRQLYKGETQRDVIEIDKR